MLKNPDYSFNYCFTGAIDMEGTKEAMDRIYKVLGWTKDSRGNSEHYEIPGIGDISFQCRDEGGIRIWLKPDVEAKEQGTTVAEREMCQKLGIKRKYFKAIARLETEREASMIKYRTAIEALEQEAEQE